MEMSAREEGMALWAGEGLSACVCVLLWRDVLHFMGFGKAFWTGSSMNWTVGPKGEVIP